MSEPSSGEWVRVSERLPESDDVVLTFNKNGFHNLATNVRLNAIYPHLGYLGASLDPNRPIFGITHWMPLPAPPKDAQEEKG